MGINIHRNKKGAYVEIIYTWRERNNIGKFAYIYIYILYIMYTHLFVCLFSASAMYIHLYAYLNLPEYFERLGFRLYMCPQTIYVYVAYIMYYI